MSNSTLIEDEEKDDPRTDFARTQALDHAWNWWKYHGDQRIAMVRFYLVALGAIAAGIGVLQQQERHVLCALLSLFGALCAFSFLNLDRRTGSLVKIGEQALLSEQSRLALATGSDAFRICELADMKRDRWPSTYGENFRLLLRVATAMFVVMAAYSVANSRHVLLLIHGF